MPSFYYLSANTIPNMESMYLHFTSINVVKMSLKEETSFKVHILFSLYA